MSVRSDATAVTTSSIWDVDTGTSASTWPITWTDTPTTIPKDDWIAEWKKLRGELLERLLSDNPEGIIKYHQERTSDYPNQVRVKLTLEYFPLVKEGKPRKL